MDEAQRNLLGSHLVNFGDGPAGPAKKRLDLPFTLTNEEIDELAGAMDDVSMELISATNGTANCVLFLSKHM